ncbi:MAG: hypothetical protein LBB41_05495 [Prevotellaceae bacterium]|jgi:hypothetical protein|nr:hypothetical protein [Prevotellaceae bacterium]
MSENLKLSTEYINASKKELPVLHGFSGTSVKNMHIFYEAWVFFVNRQMTFGDLQVNENLLLTEFRQSLTDEINPFEFLKIGFSHYLEIIFKAKTWKK